MNDSVSVFQFFFAPIFMSCSDIFLLYYLCGGNLDHIKKKKNWIFWFSVSLLACVVSQIFFNGKTNAQANYFLFYAVRFLLLSFFTAKCTDLHGSARYYLVVLSVLANDICLIVYIYLTRTFFNIDLIDLGSFELQVVSHFILLLLKIGLTVFIKRQTRKQICGMTSVFQASIIILPALPYFFLRSYAYFFNINPLEVPLIIHFVDILCGVCALINMVINERLAYQVRQNELLRMESLIRKQHDNYLTNLNAFESVSRKYHDLRHILRGIESMQSVDEVKAYAKNVEGEIIDYELVCNTGNKTLDIILSDRMRECKAKGIQMHVHADGHGWENIHDIDIATIYGNALDNAIESAIQNTIGEQRVIDVRTGRVNDMLIARFENQFTHLLEKKQTKLITTKDDKLNHGYGLQSICLAVNKYNGEVDIATENGVFTLTVIIPLAEENQKGSGNVWVPISVGQ